MVTALKWPNDVLVPGDDDRKLAGLLCEWTEAGVVVGLGLNVDTARGDLPLDTATSLRAAGAPGVDRASAAHGLPRAPRPPARRGHRPRRRRPDRLRRRLRDGGPRGRGARAGRSGATRCRDRRRRCGQTDRALRPRARLPCPPATWSTSGHADRSERSRCPWRSAAREPHADGSPTSPGTEDVGRRATPSRRARPPGRPGRRGRAGRAGAARPPGLDGAPRGVRGRRRRAGHGPPVLARDGLPERRGRRGDVHRGRPRGAQAGGPDHQRRAGQRGARPGHDPGLRPHRRPAGGVADPARRRVADLAVLRGARGPRQPLGARAAGRRRRRRAARVDLRRHRAAAGLRLAPPPHQRHRPHARGCRPGRALRPLGPDPGRRLRRPGVVHLASCAG